MEKAGITNDSCLMLVVHIRLSLQYFKVSFLAKRHRILWPAKRRKALDRGIFLTVVECDLSFLQSYSDTTCTFGICTVRDHPPGESKRLDPSSPWPNVPLRCQ